MPTNQLDTGYTQQVKELILHFFDNRGRAPSLVSDAEAFYLSFAAETKKRDAILQKIESADTEEQTALAQDKLKLHDKAANDSRLERLERVNQFTNKLIDLTEGNSETDTFNATAKFLGTLLLITDNSDDSFVRQHQILKPIYKAALALRLADSLLALGNIRHSYLGKYIDSHSRFKGNRHWKQRWRTELAAPLIKAALLQDIGLYHPQAKIILHGEQKDKNEFRVLTDKERKTLLKLNLQYSLAYLKRGLGVPAIPADTRQERDQKLFIEEQALEFALEAIQDATILKNHVGDLIKIPQIYTSFVLSTKVDYSKKDLPKGYMVIEQLMKKQALDTRIAGCFLKMVGYFPQGFGITFISFDDQGNLKDGYEFGIVNRLRPKNPAEPTLRAVTRNLRYISSGRDVVVKKTENLYFSSNHKKIQRIDKERLNEILKQLSGGKQLSADDMIPQFWEPYDFFLEKKHQNLWNFNPN